MMLQNKLITCQYKVHTEVGVVKDSKEFFPPKQKILDETLSVYSPKGVALYMILSLHILLMNFNYALSMLLYLNYLLTKNKNYSVLASFFRHVHLEYSTSCIYKFLHAYLTHK